MSFETWPRCYKWMLTRFPWLRLSKLTCKLSPRSSRLDLGTVNTTYTRPAGNDRGTQHFSSWLVAQRLTEFSINIPALFPSYKTWYREHTVGYVSLRTRSGEKNKTLLLTSKYTYKQNEKHNLFVIWHCAVPSHNYSHDYSHASRDPSCRRTQMHYSSLVVNFTHTLSLVLTLAHSEQTYPPRPAVFTPSEKQSVKHPSAGRWQQKVSYQSQNANGLPRDFSFLSGIWPLAPFTCCSKEKNISSTTMLSSPCSNARCNN